MSLILIKLLFFYVLLFFTVVRESIRESSQEETHQNVETNSPHDPQGWADNEVDEEFVSLDAQEVLGTWQDLLAALQPPALSVSTVAQPLEVAAPEEAGVESEDHEITEGPSVAVRQVFSEETEVEDAVPKARAPDEATEVEHDSSVDNDPEVYKPCEHSIESEFTEICKIEGAAAIVCEISGDVPAQLAATMAIEEKSPGSEEAGLLALAPCET